MTRSQEIYLVRHGQTDFNVHGVVQGRGVDSDLNETGREQARRFHALYGEVPFVHVFVSSLKRSRQTAEPFTARGLPWSAHPELDEIDWGDHEGTQASAAMRVAYRAILDGWKAGRLDVRLPGGESPLDVRDRQRRFLDSILPEAGSPVLVVSHGRALRILMCTLFGRPLTEMDRFGHANLGLYHVVRTGSTFASRTSNCTRHLDGMPPAAPPF